MSVTSLSLCFLSTPDNVHTQRWCTAMAARGHHVTLISRGPCRMRSWLGIEVLDFFPRGLTGRIRRWRSYVWGRRVRKFLKGFHADVYHMQQFSSTWPSRHVMAGASPWVISVWGADIVADRPESLFQRRAKRKGLAQVDLICATTHFLKQHTLKYCKPGRRIEVVPFGVDLHQFTPADRPANTPVIGFVKHLLPKYGPDVLIRAMRIVVNEIPDARLIMAGAGPMEGELRMLTDELNLQDYIEFRGRVPHTQVPGLIRNFAVMAMPSIYQSESFGVAAIEAGACGVPVVASRIGGVSEAVVDGRTGLLVPPHDVEALAEALIRLLKNPGIRLKMGEAGREFVREQYNWQDNVRRMEELYFEVAGVNSPTRA